MVRPADVEALKQLALLGAMDDAVELSSSDFAGLLDTSQQTGSRRLIELTEAGFIRREMGLRRQRIQVTADGRSVLQNEFDLYRRLFDGADSLAIRGKVETGLGEGRYYLSRPGYETRFEALLGWVPYPGTLNLRLSGSETNKLRLLKRRPVHVIERFEDEGRTFGGVLCHPAMVGDTPCATVLPNRSHHRSTLELIAPVRLRDALPCHDGDALTASVRLTDA